MAGNNRQCAKNFVERQRHADDARGANKEFLRSTAESLRGFGNRPQGGGMARFAGGAIRVSGIHDNSAHAAFRRAQVLFGNEHGCSNDKVLCEDGGG